MSDSLNGETCSFSVKESLRKYLSVSKNDVSLAEANLEVSTSSLCRSNNDDGPSWLSDSKLKLFDSHSSSFVTKYAKVKSSDFQLDSSLEHCSKSEPRMLKALDSASFLGVQNSKCAGESSSLRTALQDWSVPLKLPENDRRDVEEMDTTINPNFSSGENSYDLELRTCPSIEAASPVCFGKISGLSSHPEAKENKLPHLLGPEDFDTELCPRRPDVSAINAFSLNMSKLPVFDYESDDSIVENSQPKLAQAKWCESKGRLSCNDRKKDVLFNKEDKGLQYNKRSGYLADDPNGSRISNVHSSGWENSVKKIEAFQSNNCSSSASSSEPCSKGSNHSLKEGYLLKAPDAPSNCCKWNAGSQSPSLGNTTFKLLPYHQLASGKFKEQNESKSKSRLLNERAHNRNDLESSKLLLDDDDANKLFGKGYPADRKSSAKTNSSEQRLGISYKRPSCHHNFETKENISFTMSNYGSDSEKTQKRMFNEFDYEKSSKRNTTHEELSAKPERSDSTSDTTSRFKKAIPSCNLAPDLVSNYETNMKNFNRFGSSMPSFGKYPTERGNLEKSICRDSKEVHLGSNQKANTFSFNEEDAELIKSSPEEAARTITGEAGSDAAPKRRLRAVVQVKDVIGSCLGSASSALRDNCGTTFRPIVSAPPTHQTLPVTVPSPVRTTDASSKMELEQIFVQSIKSLNTFPSADNGKTNRSKVVRKVTPFAPSQTSNVFVSTSAEILTRCSPRKEHSKGVNLSVGRSDSSNSEIGLKTQHLNSKTGTGPFKETDEQTVSETSASVSSTFLSPMTQQSQALNFTRILNTDANNNTLPGKKILKTDSSPSLLLLTKPTKTYLKTVKDKPNYTWFQRDGGVQKKNANIIRPTYCGKKKLFYLPSSYQASVTSSDSQTRALPVQTNLNNKKKISTQIMLTPTLFDIGSQKGFTPVWDPSLKTKKNQLTRRSLKDSNERPGCRRSVRKKKKINYKEISEESEKSMDRLSVPPRVSKPLQKDIIKNMILNSVKNDKRGTQSNSSGHSGDAPPNSQQNQNLTLPSNCTNLHLNNPKTDIISPPNSNPKQISKLAANKNVFDSSKKLRKDTVNKAEDDIVETPQNVKYINKKSNNKPYNGKTPSKTVGATVKNKQGRNKITPMRNTMSLPKILSPGNTQNTTCKTAISLSHLPNKPNNDLSSSAKKSPAVAQAMPNKTNTNLKASEHMVGGDVQAPPPLRPSSLEMKRVQVLADIHLTNHPSVDRIDEEEELSVGEVKDQDTLNNGGSGGNCDAAINRSGTSKNDNHNSQNIISLINTIQDGIKQVDRSVQKLYHIFSQSGKNKVVRS